MKEYQALLNAGTNTIYNTGFEKTGSELWWLLDWQTIWFSGMIMIVRLRIACGLSKILHKSKFSF